MRSPLQSSWTLTTVLDVRRRTARTWMRDSEVVGSPSGAMRVTAPLVAPCPSWSDNDNSHFRPKPCSLSFSPESTPLTDYDRYCLSVLSYSSLRSVLRLRAPCTVQWLSDYEEYLNRVPPHGLAPRLQMDRPLPDNAAYLLYCARVQQLLPTVSVRPFKRLHPCHRRGRLGSPPAQISSWEEEFHRYLYQVSVSYPSTPLARCTKLRPMSSLLPPIA